MNLEQALQTFLVESRELLQEMENALLQVETEPDAEEGINAIFRAAHTIKGSAGLFGFDPIVAFTHVVESVLDKVRNREIAITPDLAALLLACCDHVGELVDVVAEQKAELAPDMCVREAGLLDKLRAHLGGGQPQFQAGNTVAAQAPNRVQSCGGGQVETGNWHISLRFGREVLRNGMDPLSFIRYLETLGQIVSLTTLPDAIPSAEEMDPESCYLGFEIDFCSAASKEAIENVFEFVHDDCLIRILPPHSRIEEYLELIRFLPEEDTRLGNLLVASGALTQKELEEGLRSQRQQVPPPPPLGEVLVAKGVVQQEVVDAALTKQAKARETKSKESRHIRVQADKLDQHINLVGELVIASASAAVLAQRTGDRAVLEAVASVSRLVEEIRNGALQLRMVPIGETFSRFQRVVHDVSRELGKEIELVITGAETELDKSVVEKIGDPLTHLVRNAMDHGIEPVETRRANGKPDKGTLHLNACHDSGSIVIEIADDGGGLNRQKILAKAIEKGVVSPSQNLSDREICNLIFEAGFSTAEQVTNLSGRGVGMDVVKRNISALRGMVDLESEEGVGTTVSIRLPLTLAIIDGFLVGTGKHSYVIPLDMVVECVELPPNPQETDPHYINLRGEVLPFLRLRDQFKIGGTPPLLESMVVVQYGSQRAGVVVDKLMGEFQTVIKPLGKMFSHLKGISGSTILGSGDVALILDVLGLINKVATGVNEREMAMG